MSNKIKNYVVVDMDFDTGELLHQHGLYYSEAQLQAWNKYRQKMAAIENGRANPFVWHSFAQGYETFDMLSSASIPRMFYLATFCGYDGMLVDGASNVLTKKQLSARLGLQSRASKSFWGEMREAGILAFDNSKYVYMNPQYFSRGTAPMNTCFTRVYTNFYREAYEKYGDVRRHKLLAYGFRLVPYISHHHNVLCKNPQEPCLDKLIPYQMQEIYDILRYNSHTGRRLIDDLLNIKINDQYMMTVYSSTVEAPAKKLFVNPRLLYAGGHPDEMRNEYDYMILKHHPEEGQTLLSTQVYHTQDDSASVLTEKEAYK